MECQYFSLLKLLLSSMCRRFCFKKHMKRVRDLCEVTSDTPSRPSLFSFLSVVVENKISLYYKDYRILMLMNLNRKTLKTAGLNFTSLHSIHRIDFKLFYDVRRLLIIFYSVKRTRQAWYEYTKFSKKLQKMREMIMLSLNDEDHPAYIVEFEQRITSSHITSCNRHWKNVTN